MEKISKVMRKCKSKVKYEIERKNEVKEYVDLYDTDKVFLFMNVPTKGGIVEQINNMAVFFKSLGKEVNFVCEGYRQIPEGDLFNLDEIKVDNIYVMSEVEDFTKIITDGSLLLFTQMRIAKSFINFYEKNKVIVQYHRNINDATDSILEDINLLQTAICEGEIQLLEPQNKINRNKKFRGIKEFTNFIHAPEQINFGKVDEVTNIGYISRLTDNDNAKNINGVIRIIKKALELNPNLVFHVYGEGDKKDEFASLSDNVVVHGFKYNKKEIYKDLDLVILPSVSEAFPMVLVEALAYGIKVVSYNNTNMINRIISDQVGSIIKLNDEENFAHTIATMGVYDREEVISYANKNFIFNDEEMASYVTLKKKPSYNKNRTVYYYDCRLDNKTLYLGFFSTGYYLDLEEIFVGSSIPYKKYKNNDYDLYSELAYNFKRQFFTVEVNIDHFKAFDYLKLHKNRENANIAVTRQGVRRIPLDKDKALVLNNNEFILEEYASTEMTDEDIFNYVSNEKSNSRKFLFQDRNDKAHDNGEALFKYALKSEKYKKEDLYFVIEDGAEDYFRLIEEGVQVIAKDSNKHKYLYLASEALCTSHIKKEIFTPFNTSDYKFYKKSKTVFLQHGILFNESDYRYFLNTLMSPVDMMITSTKAEKELVEGITNYDKIVLTGLARHDLLNSEKNNGKTIFYFPTWNRTIDMSNFKNTKYFENITKFLYSEELTAVLKVNGIKIKFLLHPELEENLKYFKNTEVVEVLNPHGMEFSKVLSECAMLITDVSSIAWDAAYQNKPILAFAPYSTHSSYDGTPMEKIGHITSNTQDAINHVIKLVNTGFKISEEQQKAISDLFAYQDNNNSKRIMEEVELLVNSDSKTHKFIKRVK